jgi:2-iminobutanoate/2-iminopropanoate deaminase
MVEIIEKIDNAPLAIGPYSPIAKTGNLYFFSGQIPIDPQTSKLVEGDIREQTSQVLSNIDSLLTAVKLNNKNITKTTIFLTDLSNFKDVNEVYAKWLNGHKPARSTVEVSALPMGATIEIECIVEA